ARSVEDGTARKIQLSIEYDPAPPFPGGTPFTSPPEIVKARSAKNRVGGGSKPDGIEPRRRRRHRRPGGPYIDAALSPHPDRRAGGWDPVGVGWVQSLARPGGNVTGFTNLELSVFGKVLET